MEVYSSTAAQLKIVYSGECQPKLARHKRVESLAQLSPNFNLPFFYFTHNIDRHLNPITPGGGSLGPQATLQLSETP